MASHTYKIVYNRRQASPLDEPSTELQTNTSPRERGDTCVAVGDTCVAPKDTDLASELDAPPPVAKFKKWKLSVTDFSSQLWCETQLQFSLTTGFRRETQAMKDGIARHEKLESQDHEVVEIEVCTAEDNLGVRLLNTIISFDHLLPVNRKVREVWLVGTFAEDQCVVRGIVDEFALVKEDGFTKVVIRDTKTRREEVEPSMSQKRTSAMQLQMYHYMVDRLRCGSIDWECVWKAFKVDPHANFESEVLKKQAPDLEALSQDFEAAMRGLPPLANYVVVEYDCNGVVFKCDSIPYSASVTVYTLNDLLGWWMGSRGAGAVMQHESWKCRQCDFLSCCQASPLPPDEKSAILDERRLADLSQGLSDIESPLTRPSLKATQSQSPSTQYTHPLLTQSTHPSSTQSAHPSATQPTQPLSDPVDQPGSRVLAPRETATTQRATKFRGKFKRPLPVFGPTGVSPQKKQPVKLEGAELLASRANRRTNKPRGSSCERSLMFINHEFASVFK